MTLGHKLRLTYLSLFFAPIMVMVVLAFISYFSGISVPSFQEGIRAPGWIQPELQAIFSEDQERYDAIEGKYVITIIDASGESIFEIRGVDASSELVIHPPKPRVRNKDNILSKEFFDEVTHAEDPSKVLLDFSLKYGVEWDFNLNITPVLVNEIPYVVVWADPNEGIPGFVARGGWIYFLGVFLLILLIPSFFDARLRRSMRRLLMATNRLRNGQWEQPLEIPKRDDLKELAESFENARVELLAAREQRTLFLMAVSHDLRTPLTSLKGYIEALEDGMAETEEDFAHYLSVLGDKASLLENRIGELIQFAREETGGSVRFSEQIDATELMERLDAHFRKDAGFAQISYSSQLKIPNGTYLEGDKDALYRAWENLFANALKYAKMGRFITFRVQIQTDSQGKTSLIGSVIDDGLGVDEAFVPYLFDPFSRADRGRNNDGMGLGLASARSVALAHRGSIVYEPGTPHGAQFHISIPCVIPPKPHS
ncbi:MAG: HAMP domain-containing histidine kinase [Spirochaetales bacterium]|nr:HAMP domain-containing histidine kinase [Spirochaetales bacterium]